MSVEQALVDELTSLRRGWAVQDANLRQRLGPNLLRLCGVGPSDNDRDVQRRVRSWLTDCCAELPAELRRAAVLALALDPNQVHRRLTVRVERLAFEHAYASRTARRRVDHAFRLIARAALRDLPPAVRGDPADPETGWRVRSLRAVVRLDKPSPELHENRTIVATRDGLTHVAVRLSVPNASDRLGRASDVAVDVVRGARVVDHETRHDAQYFRWVLALPRTLAAGDEHEVELVHCIAPDRAIHPHYAYLPLVACERFTVSVRFPPDRRPRVLWRLYAVPPRLLDDERPGADRLSLDDAGEVRLAFGDLRQGHGYGLAWTL